MTCVQGFCFCTYEKGLGRIMLVLLWIASSSLRYISTTPGGDWVVSGLPMGCGKRSRVFVGLTLDCVEQEVIAILLMSLAAKDT